MSKTLKWILGIVAALVVVAVVVAAVYVLWSHAPLSFSYRLSQPNAPLAPATPGAPSTQPNQPYGFREYRGFPNDGFGRRMPMFGGRSFYNIGMFPFGLFFLGGFIRLLIPVLIMVLIAILFYQLGRRAGAAPAPATPPSQPPSTPKDAPTPAPGRKVAKS